MVNDTLLPAAIGAAGAVGVDLLWDYLPIPDTLKAGPLAAVTRIGLAVGVGYVAGMVGGKAFGKQAAAGSIIVTLADLAKGYLQTVIPAPVALPVATTTTAAAPGVGVYVGDDLGVYVGQGGDGLGWWNSGTNVGPYH